MFKVGDIVRCKPDFNREEGSGGSGYLAGQEFTVYRITIGKGDRSILWRNSNRVGGVYAEACELVTYDVWADSKLIFKFV